MASKKTQRKTPENDQINRPLSDGMQNEAMGNSSATISNNACCVLVTSNIWERFQQLGGEMIVTNKERNMYPVIYIKFIDEFIPTDIFSIMIDVIPVNNCKYKFFNNKWSIDERCKYYKEIIGDDKLIPIIDQYVNGKTLMESVIRFTTLKITSNQEYSDKPQHILVKPCYHYQIRIHLIYLNKKCSLPLTNEELLYFEHRTYTFDDLKFMAVESYQLRKEPMYKGLMDEEWYHLREANSLVREFEFEERKQITSRQYPQTSRLFDSEWRHYQNPVEKAPRFKKSNKQVKERYQQMCQEQEQRTKSRKNRDIINNSTQTQPNSAPSEYQYSQMNATGHFRMPSVYPRPEYQQVKQYRNETERHLVPIHYELPRTENQTQIFQDQNQSILLEHKAPILNEEQHSQSQTIHYEFPRTENQPQIYQDQNQSILHEHTAPILNEEQHFQSQTIHYEFPRTENQPQIYQYQNQSILHEHMAPILNVEQRFQSQTMHERDSNIMEPLSQLTENHTFATSYEFMYPGYPHVAIKYVFTSVGYQVPHNRNQPMLRDNIPAMRPSMHQSERHQVASNYAIPPLVNEYSMRLENMPAMETHRPERHPESVNYPILTRALQVVQDQNPPVQVFRDRSTRLGHERPIMKPIIQLIENQACAINNASPSSEGQQQVIQDQPTPLENEPVILEPIIRPTENPPPVTGYEISHPTYQHPQQRQRNHTNSEQVSLPLENRYGLPVMQYVHPIQPEFQIPFSQPHPVLYQRRQMEVYFQYLLGIHPSRFPGYNSPIDYPNPNNQLPFDYSKK